MQRDLFPGLNERRKNGLMYRNPKPEDVILLADHLQANGLTEKFSFSLVGSMLDSSRESADMDVIVSLKPGATTTIVEVESVLLSLRRYGAWTLNIELDPCFRRLNEPEIQRRAGLGLAFSSWRLESPQHRWQATKKCKPGTLRRVGRYLIVIRRPLAQTAYFKKLPQGNGKGRPARILRPAIPLSMYCNDTNRPK